MSALASFQGQSGRLYHYAMLDIDGGAAPTILAGIFVFARPSTNDPNIIYVGAAESVFQALTTAPSWAVAKAKHGATAAYFRVELNARARGIEVQDLVRKHRPPMNLEAGT